MTIQPAPVVRKRGAFCSASVALAALLIWGAPVIPAFSWSPGTAAASETGRFGVDTANRRDVLSFYHAVYGASEGFEARAAWSGNVAALAPGTTSLELKKDVLRRVNFYRALTGLPADLTLNPEKSVKAQEAALLAARNRGLSHYPGHELPEWAGLNQLPLGVEASAKSNLSLGAYGPAAVDGQMRDDGEANWYVGHRRWLLSPKQAEIGTGDVPEQAGFPAANALWVVGDFKDAAPAQYVLWPNKGYTPAPLLPRRWSVSYPGADFSSATVSLSRNGVPVPVQITSTSSGPTDSVQGEKTLVWEPLVALPFASEDVTYSVQVNGIRIGGMPGNLAYTVTAFDPGVLGETLSITGGGDLTPAGGSYVFNGIAQADSYELTVARGSAGAWMEGAEGPVVQVLTNTTPGYAVVQSQVAASGLSAFHLTHPGITSAGFADQTFQLKRRLVPGPDSVLQFTETGRFAETSTSLTAEVSVDDGLNWSSVWSRTGVGLNSALFDKGWNPHAVSLGAYSGKVVLVRFSLKSNGGPVAAGTTKDHGFFIDNILLTNGLELVDAKVTTLAGTATDFVLNSATAGASLMEGNRYYLSVAPRVGTRLFPSSPLTVASVPVVSAMATVAAVEPPVINVQPLEARVAAGFPVVFSVQATGGGTLRYQWRKNGVALPGETAATYRIESAQKTDESYGGTAGYDVVVTGDADTVTSTRVALTVVEGGAYILENPAGSSVQLGGTHTMWVTSADTEVTYQWRKNGVEIAGATGSSLTLSAFKSTDAGRYDVVIRQASFGEVWSSPAYVGVASKVVANLQNPTYAWTTLAGNGLAGSANGTGLAAQFDNPSSIAMDGLGNLYVSDTGNHVIRRVTQAGVVTTVAGLVGTPGTANGSALSTARLDSPKGIAVDKAGAVYIAEPGNNAVRKLTNPGQSTAVVSTVAGVAGQFGVAGGLNSPLKVAVDPNGNVYVMDYFSIRKVVSATQFNLLLGDLSEANSGIQPGPIAMTVDSSGKIFAAAYDGGELKVFSAVAGGTFSSTNYGPYSFPIADLAVGAGSMLYAATESSVELLGDISQSTPASGLPVNLTSGVHHYAVPCGVTVDASGTVYAVDSFLNTVIKGVPSGLPVFLSHPTGGTGTKGVPLTLTAIAVSPDTITYQWYRDGVAIAGATAASYTMASGGSGGGVYTVEASNAAGTVTSTAATVEGVATTLEILNQPQPAAAVLGSPAELKVSWESSSLTTIQWYRNGVALTGATSATFSFPAVRASDAGDYRVELRSGPFVRTSNTVRLTVNIPVSIFSEPEDVSVERGALVNLKVAATGTPLLTYQWRKNGTPIVGANQPTYEFTADTSAEYDVEVNNVVGMRETSRRAMVSVLTRPAVTLQPQDRTANRNATATFTVTATGSAPLGYQWRRNGVPIAAGTAASLTVQNVQEENEGLYDVVVSNAVGTAASKTAKLNVNLPASIAVQPPAAITASVGASVFLRVVAVGSGTLSYQWLKDNISIPNANKASYQASTSEAGTAQYRVEVTSDVYGNKVQSAVTTLTVSAARGIALLRAPAPETNMIRGTAAGLKLSVDENPRDAVRTTYRLFTFVNNALGTDTGIGGIVPAGGDLEVPLRSLTTGGSYAVVFSREYSDGEPVSGVKTAAFTVNLRTLEDAAGTYELLLADSNGLVGDGATQRGVLIATVSRTGAVSGRVLYNEAPSLPDADVSERSYTAVARSFSSAFVPSATDPGKLVCTPKLGIGTQANRQALELELDFSAPMVELNAEVHDRISVSPEIDAEGCVSRGFGAVRGATNLTKVAVGSEMLDFSSLTGRYSLGSDFAEASWSGPGLDNNATILAQVLATGKLLWATRLSGFTGSGSATLSTSERDAATAQFYLARTLSTTTALSTNSLLGQLCFTRLNQGTLWSAKVANAYGEEKLERQSCHITKTNKLPAYIPERFALINAGSSSFNWSGVGSLNFQSGTSCRWTGSTTAGLLAFLNPASAVTPASIPPLYLTAEDPAGEGSYVWTINVSGAGTVKTANYSATDSQPTLTLRLDRTRGEWTGSYVSPRTRLRRTIAGVLARPPEEDSLRGAGWVELGTIPSTQTSGWRLELTAP